MKQYQISEDQVKTLGTVIQQCLANEITDNPTDPPVVPPPEPPTPSPGYPEPDRRNLVKPGDLTLTDDGGFSFHGETILDALRRRGFTPTDDVNACCFEGWDFPRFWAHNLAIGSEIDMVGCTFRDQRRNALDINFYGDRNAGQDPLTGRPGGLLLRIFDSKFLRNYSPNPNTADEHSVGALLRGRAVDELDVEIYNGLFRYNGSGPDRDATAGMTDHALYPQGRPKHLVTKDCAWLDWAAQASKGGCEYVYHSNLFAANGATFGFFGPDAGETDKFGEFTTFGGMKDALIYGMTDILAKKAPHSYGLIFNGGCDITLENVHIVNPNPTVNPDRPLHAFHCVDMRGRPINVRFKNVHLYGYDYVFGGDTEFLTESTTDSVDAIDGVNMHPRIKPGLDLNEARQLLDSGAKRPDEMFAWGMNQLGLEVAG